MDLATIVGALAALAGVALGALLTYRTQKALLVQGHVQSRAISREQAYVDFLGACREFRRVLLTQDLQVRLVPRDDDPSVNVAGIGGVAESWAAVDKATAHVLIVAARNKSLLERASAVRDSNNRIAEARAAVHAGAVPARLVKEAKDAERAFAEAAEADLWDR